MRSFSIGIILCLTVSLSACGGAITHRVNEVGPESYVEPTPSPEPATPEVAEIPAEDPLLTDAELLEQRGGSLISFEDMADGEWRITPPVFTIRNRSNVDLVIMGSVQDSIMLITVRDTEDFSPLDVAIYGYLSFSSSNIETVGNIREREAKYYFRYQGVSSDNLIRGLVHTSTLSDGKIIRFICSWTSFDTDAENDAFAESLINMASSVKFRGMK